MKYISTRGQAPELDFPDVVTTGLASDGGLYVPREWPRVDSVDLQRFRSLSYAELTVEIMGLFAGDSIPRTDLQRMSRAAHRKFCHPALAPLVQIDENQWIMELFHGPTLAFKDFALQFLGQLFEYLLSARNEHRTIVGATSGDTGSAAIDAVRGLPHVRLFMLHPAGRVSEVQRRQMTTIADENIHNLAIDGDFADCQRLVKAMFNDAPFREAMGLSAVNSINWARVAAQVVYYFRAALTLGSAERPVSFAVPSGNFGNVFAGYVARCMGLPIRHFVVGSNHNDILTRFFASGIMQAEVVRPSITPSMDIQVSSNFERLLFEMTERDGSVVSNWMSQFAQHGSFAVEESRFAALSDLFSAARLSDDQTRQEMRGLYDATGYVIDPHSAIGVATAKQAIAARPELADGPMVVLATAHPAKFPDAVRTALGIDAPLPARVASIMHATEHLQHVPADLTVVQSLIRAAS